MASRPRLSVLVPVYNEVGTVRTLIERVMAVPIPPVGYVLAGISALTRRTAVGRRD